jgi:hypothetical protein
MTLRCLLFLLRSSMRFGGYVSARPWLALDEVVLLGRKGGLHIPWTEFGKDIVRMPGLAAPLRNLMDELLTRFGHCCRWFNDMRSADEDPIAVIQWPVEFVDRE